MDESATSKVGFEASQLGSALLMGSALLVGSARMSPPALGDFHSLPGLTWGLSLMPAHRLLPLPSSPRLPWGAHVQLSPLSVSEDGFGPSHLQTPTRAQQNSGDFMEQDCLF